MNENPTSGPRKSILAALALVTLAAGSARAQTPTNETPPAGAVEATPPAPPPPPPPAALAPVPAPSPPPAPPLAPPAQVPANGGSRQPEGNVEPNGAGPNFESTWFTRTPLKITLGAGENTWSIAFFGTIEADYITDSTRSYNEIIGGNLVARGDTYEGTVGRTQFSMRNTRVGLLLDSPKIAGVTPSAVFQGDFGGNQPGTPYVIPGAQVGSTISENAYYNSPTFRIRHAYLTLRNPYVDVLAGHTFDVFGFQNFYTVTSLLGIPNQVSTRTAQFRLSRTFGAGGPISLDVALEAARPVQRDSMVPDAMAGLRHAGAPPGGQQLEGDHDAGCRGHHRGAAFALRVRRQPPVQAERVHAAARAGFEPHHGLGRVGGPVRAHHPGGARQRSREPGLDRRLVRVRHRHRRPHLRRRQRALPDAAELDAVQPAAGVHGRHRQRSGDVRHLRRGPHHRLVRVQGRAPVLLPGQRPSAAGGELQPGALEQPRQAVPAGRRRDRAAGQRRQHDDVHRRHPDVGRDAGGALRPLGPVHAGHVPGRQQAAQHPRHRPGALHVLKSRRRARMLPV